MLTEVKLVSIGRGPVDTWQSLHLPLPRNSFSPVASCAVSVAVWRRYTSNFELNGETAGEASNAATARPIRWKVAVLLARPVADRCSGVWLAAPSLTMEQMVAALAGQSMSSAAAPYTWVKKPA